LKSTETASGEREPNEYIQFQQFRLVEEH